MRLRTFALLSGLMLSVLPIACGGGGGTPPPTPISILTTSLNQGQTTVAYTAPLSATGGTPPYTWSLASGSTLPAALSLSTTGTISGTPTTAGLSSFVVQVMDSASTPQSTTQKLSLAISGGALKITSVNAVPGTVGASYQFQLLASGGVPPYTWALASGSSPLPGGLSVNSSGSVSGTPTAVGAFSPQIQVTDATTNNTASQNVNFSMNPAGTPLPAGDYVFQFSGTSPAPSANPVEINGDFETSGNGSIGPGFYNENVLNQPAMPQGTITGGLVSVASNGLGQMVMTLASGGNITFALAAPVSSLTAGNTSDIRIIEFDDTTGSGMRGSGSLRIAPALESTSPITKGGYAFGFKGFDTHSQPVALAGSFQADGAGNISGGEVDMNDNGTASSFSAVTGTYTADSVAGGVITLNLAAGNTVKYNYFAVTQTGLTAISADVTSSTIPLVGGSVLQQSGTFSNASLTGAYTLELNGLASQNGTYIPDISLGLLTINTGVINTTYDEYKGQLQSPQSYSATYTVNAASGRVAVTASGTPPILYLVSSAMAFVLGTDTSTSSGVLESQSGSPFSNASFKGNYLGGTISPVGTDVVSLVSADGNGNVQYTYNSSGPKGLLTNQSLSGTYSASATGRVPVTVSGDSTPRIFYVVSPSKVVYLSGENGGYLGSFEQ